MADIWEKTAVALYEKIIEGKELPVLPEGWEVYQSFSMGGIPMWNIVNKTYSVRGVEQNPAPGKKWTFLVKAGHKVVHIFIRNKISGREDWRLVVDGKVYDNDTSKGLLK